MNIDLIKLCLSSSIYSLTPLFEKSILGIIHKDLYLFLKYTFRFIIILFMNVFKNNNIINSLLFEKINNIKYYLLGSAIVAFTSQHLYLDVLKNNDISYIEPIGNVLINIFSVLIGYLALKEPFNNKKILGLILGTSSIFLLA